MKNSHLTPKYKCKFRKKDKPYTNNRHTRKQRLKNLRFLKTQQGEYCKVKIIIIIIILDEQAGSQLDSDNERLELAERRIDKKGKLIRDAH